MRVDTMLIRVGCAKKNRVSIGIMNRIFGGDVKIMVSRRACLDIHRIV
jgi:hypothetical protein